MYSQMNMWRQLVDAIDEKVTEYCNATWTRDIRSEIHSVFSMDSGILVSSATMR